MPDTKAAIIANVRAELARAGMSARRAARELNWPHHVLSERMRGQTSFRAEQLIDLAKLLDIPVTTFYGDTAVSESSTASQ